MNVLKKVVASVAACAALGTMAVSAYASTSDKFNFNLNSSNYYGWSPYAKKNTGFGTSAEIIPQGGDASASKPVYVTAYYIMKLGNVYRVSGTNTLKSNSNPVYLSYTDANLVEAGKTYSLLGETGTYSVTANGYWNP